MKHPAGSSRQVDQTIIVRIQVWTSASPKRPSPPAKRIILHLKAYSQTRIAVRIVRYIPNIAMISIFVLDVAHVLPNGSRG